MRVIDIIILFKYSYIMVYLLYCLHADLYLKIAALQ